MSTPPYAPAERDALLADLNPAQREAVTHAGGPLLVVAGAGTGKTRVLTRRVAWLAAGGLPAASILAITFTNKAARVLRGRLADLPWAEGVWAGTFHAFGSWALRRWGDHIGLDRSFTILDREDQERLVRDLLRDLDLRGLEDFRPVAMLSHLKNGAGGRPPMDLSAPALAERFDRLHRAYEERLAAASLVDFDDLLLRTLRLLRESEEAAEAMRGRFAHVLVDEYQDTNLVQRDLLLALLGGRGGVTVVGDPDQSIYRWRGASVRNILEFADQVPGTTTVVLDRNYRSTKTILEAAESVISRNRMRHEKRLRTENDRGSPIRELRLPSGEVEADVVARAIETWRGEGRRFDEAAVFYRVNSFSRAIELALRARGIPYTVVAGVEFFQRREVKDVLAYARLLENPRDDAAFLRVVNVPRRGVGDTGVRALRLEAMRRGVSLEEAARAGAAGLGSRAAGGVRAFLALLDELRALPRSPVAALLHELAHRSGYVAALHASGEEFGEGREENVTALVNHAVEQERADPALDLRGFLERAALVSDQDAYVEDGGRVSLMSVHAAKGLEFPLVVIAGAEDGWFPHARNADDPEAQEEERRLFYVAMTRARERLVVTHASCRSAFKGPQLRSPSPFLYDVPAALIDPRDRVRLPTAEELDASGESEEASFVRETSLPFAVGDRVRHPHFGEGRLEAWTGRGAAARVTIDFDDHGRKTIALGYAPLERIR